MRRPKEGGTSDDRGAVQASFAVASATNVLTLFLYAAPNASSVWVRVVEEVSGAVAEVEITANLPAATQLLSPRNYMNTGSTAAAVAYDCSGLYVETDYRSSVILPTVGAHDCRGKLMIVRLAYSCSEPTSASAARPGRSIWTAPPSTSP